MNYFNPNYYGGNSYQPQYQTQIQPVFQTPTIPGKVVDGYEVVKATEVPVGSYGVYPKADLSEIYIKSWNNNGTTNIVSFKPSIEELPNVNPALDISKVMEEIGKLNEKLDSLLIKSQESAPIKKEVTTNVTKSNF